MLIMKLQAICMAHNSCYGNKTSVDLKKYLSNAKKGIKRP